MHYHYTHWPDFGVPQNPDVFLEYLYAVRSSGALSPEVGPAVVHCSAGIGRSGTFCLVDVILAKVSCDAHIYCTYTLYTYVQPCAGALTTTYRLAYVAHRHATIILHTVCF